MPAIDEFINERSEITSLTLLNNDIVAYSTKYNGLKLLDTKEFKTHSKILLKEMNTQTTALCFSPDAKLLAFANNNIIHVVDLITKQTIKSIKTLSESIDILSFCADSTYIIAGSTSGRVYQYRYDNSALLSRLCSFSPIKKKSFESYVSAIAINKNKLACSGSGGSVFVIDLYSQTAKSVIIKKGPRVNALCFIDDDTLISANINGVIKVHTLHNDTPAKTIDAPFNNIKQIIKMPNPNFVLISSNTNYIAIADIKKAKIVHSKYAEFKDKITHVAVVNEEVIFVTLENNKILKLKIASPLDLKNYIIHNSLYEAFRLSENEPMLHDCKEYKLLEKRYEQIYKDTLNALMNQNKNLALSIIEPLKGVRSKEQEIKALFNAFDNYDRFKILYLEKKYALAYAICNKHTALQQTPLYLKLEEAFKEHFINAKRHMSIGKLDHAKALMNDYITVVSKRDLIMLFLNQDPKFMAFLKAIDEKDFQTIEELKLTNKIFAQAPTYVSLSLTIKRNINKIDTFINQGEIEKAKEHLFKFKNSSLVNQDLKRLMQKLQDMTLLQDAYKLSNFKKCYEILDTYPHLNSSELGILLNKHWAKLISECEDYALKGNAKGIKTTLDTLISISTRTNKIGDLLRVSFHSKIKASLANKNFRNAENIIYSYIDIFGNDNELSSLMNAYEVMSKTKLAITQDQNERVQRDKWLNSEVIMEINSSEQ